jgi:hypothetical protein
VPGDTASAPTSVTLFDQGVVQVLQGSVTGLMPKRSYVVALAGRADGAGPREPLATFMTNPAGSAIVNTSGPIRQIVAGAVTSGRRWLVVAETGDTGPGAVVQVQRD